MNPFKSSTSPPLPPKEADIIQGSINTHFHKNKSISPAVGQSVGGI